MEPELKLEPLNPREIEILNLIADGLSNREIAQKLYLSQETVKWYNKQIFAKLGAGSRTQAVSIAKKHRMLNTTRIPAAAVPAATGHPSRYILGEELGRGGMGIVYQGEDTLLHRAVAVKILSGEITEEGRRRLQHEAEMAAKLNHPNIVSIFDAGEMNGLPYIVMELVNGTSLHEQKPASLEEVIEIAQQICAALEHAHAQGIIHRDLKPENVILTPEGRVKILDFGLARSVASRLTQQNAIAGSVFYLAPEQALGQEVDGRADLYALGVMLYELVTGQLPYTGDDPLSVISQHLYAPLVAPSAYKAEAAPLEPVILRLLAKNPQERYATATQVMEALEAARGAEAGAQAADPRQAKPTDAVTLLNQLASGRMVGRKDEMNQLLELWRRALQGNGHLALISGEPGIGKTRLANELMVSAQLSRAMILRGGAYEYEATTPYLPFVEALREWVHVQPPEKIRGLMGDTATELARLAPEIESKLGPLPVNPGLPRREERLRLFDHVTRFLQNLAQDSGLLLFIDDLHWADQDTLALMAYVLRSLRNERVLILAAYRPVELDRKHPLAAALVEWNRERMATRVSLERLKFEETGQLLATLFGQENISEELTRAMHDETEGNPFFIEEVVKALIEQGQIYRVGDRWERKEISELAIPQSVKEAIGRRLDRLTETCLNMLHAAAVLGKEFDFNELAAMQIMGEDELLDALDEAITVQLIRTKPSEAFIFTHDKIREVLYEEINPIRRKRLHQHIGEALEAQLQAGRGSRIQEVAHHFTQSGDMERSLKYSIMAAEKASRLFALDDALSYYETAQEAAECLGQTEQLAAIHKAIGEIQFQRGQTKQAVQSFQRAIDLETHPEERGAIKALMGSVHAFTGDVRGLAVIEEALQELNRETQADEVALATAMIGRYYHYRSQHSKAIEYLERARQIAEPLERSETLSTIYAYLSGAYQHLTRFPESIAWAWKNIELGERANNPISEANGYEFLAENAFGMGEWRAALKYADRDHEIGEKIGAQDHIAWSTYCLAMGKHGLGDLAAAEKDAQATRLLATNNGDTRLMIMAGGLTVQIQGDLGKEAEVLSFGEQVLREADELDHIYIRLLTRHYYAYALYHQNEVERALELYTESEEIVKPTENRWMPMIYTPWLAQVYFDVGRREDAARMVERALEMARFGGARYHEGQALRVRAQLLAAEGRWEAALDTIGESLRILEETETRLEVGRSLVVRGKVQALRGEAEAAEADWRQALEEFERLGAVGEARKARERLEGRQKEE